jgi:hypothetical protein
MGKSELLKGGLEGLVDRIHASGWQGAVAITGGGTGAYDRLLRYGGGSATFVEGAIPYATESFSDHVRGLDGKTVTTEAVRRLAMTVFQRSKKLKKDAAKVFGVAASCSLAKKGGERAGREHKLCVAAHTTDFSWAVELRIPHGTRRAQEDVTSRTIVLAVAHACRELTLTEETLPALERELALEEEVLSKTESGLTVVSHKSTFAAPGWSALYDGEPRAMSIGDQKVEITSMFVRGARPRAILSGSFRPVHEGHQGMAKIGSEILGCEVAYELAVLNADKPAIDYIEIEERASRFGKEQLFLSNAPTFAEKSVLYPGVTFLVGADTWVRIFDPRFYGGSETNRAIALNKIQGNGCRFLVFGRLVNGVYQSSLPSHQLATFVPEDKFRMDVSSTEKRTRVTA